MKKEDLIPGRHIVELRNGDRMLYVGKYFMGQDAYMSSSNVTTNLINIITETCDIVKVFDVKPAGADCLFNHILYSSLLTCVWKIKQLYTLEEAIKSGKKFKHRDCSSFTKSATEAICDYVSMSTHEKADEHIKLKVWEIEDSE